MMFYSQRVTIDPQDPNQNTWYVATGYYSKTDNGQNN